MKREKTANSKKEHVLKKAGHHDRFFKQGYSDPRAAKELFQLVFSSEEFSAFDWESLKPEKDTFQDLMADLVFSVTLKNNPKRRVKICLLLEHKSQYSYRLFDQCLKYQTLITIKSLEETGEAWPVIVVVFYHGKEPWKWPKSLQKGLFGEAKIPFSLQKDMLNYNLRVIDTHDPRIGRAIKDKNFRSRGFLNALKGVWSLKAEEGGLKETLSLFGNWMGNRESLTLSVGDYLWSSVPGMTGELWKELEHEAVRKGIFTKGGFMDIREHFKEEGRQEGIQKGMQRGMQKGRQEGIQKGMQKGRQEGIQKGIQRGMQKGRQEGMQQVVLNMLKKQTDIAFISEVTGLSEEEIRKIQNRS